MENISKEIAELLRQIRQVENDHNRFVDEYFQNKNHLQQALNNLHNHPTHDHLNVYNSCLTRSESMMKTIRLKRLDLTNLICELHRHGVFLDEENDDDDDDDDVESSLDEGIDEHSLSALDLSSKLSSLNNSENQSDEF